MSIETIVSESSVQPDMHPESMAPTEVDGTFDRMMQAELASDQEYQSGLAELEGLEDLNPEDVPMANSKIPTGHDNHTYNVG